jgi:hypothetical protein
MNRVQFVIFLLVVSISCMVGSSLVAQNALLATAAAARRQAVTDVVTAQEYRLVDDQGKTRGIFATQEGNPVFMLFDGPRARLVLEVDGRGRPAVRLFSPQGREHASLFLDEEEARLNLQSPDRLGQVRLGTAKGTCYARLNRIGAGDCYLRVNDDATQWNITHPDMSHFVLGAGADGAVYVFGDPDDGVHISKTETESSVQVYRDGKAVWSAP